jgi:ribose transport system permease protein
MAQTLVILTASIDLSVGSLLTLISLVTAGVMQSREDMILPVVLLALGIGVLTGLINGLIITKGRVAPFIVTLGMYSILQGVALAYTTVPFGGVASSLSKALYYGQLGPVPHSLFYFIIIFVLLYVMLKITPFGRAIFAVGGNAEVARRAGIRVDRVRLMVHVLCGFLVAVASLIATARMGIGDPLAGQGMELDSITAVVIGGTSLFGGRGSLLGTLAGVLILALINNIMIILGISVFYQQLAKGIIVLAAVAIYKQRA